ncbi:MAG: hypothetical protein ABGW84_01720 [Sphingomonadaceae bacterium]|jgi:hypothetical protein
MERGDLLFGAIFFVGVGALSIASSQKIGSNVEEKERPAASAIRYLIVEMVGYEDAIDDDSHRFGPSPVCVTTDVNLDLKIISAELSSTIIRPVPASQCANGIVDGDFEFFDAITDHDETSGEGAPLLKIVDLDCPNSTNCFVDIDVHGFGERYFLKRERDVWTVERQWKRWGV